MNTKKYFDIPNILANLANFLTILNGVKDIGMISGIGGLLVLIQMYFSDFWVKTVIAFVQILPIVVLYFVCKAKELQSNKSDENFATEETRYKQIIEGLQLQLDSSEKNFIAEKTRYEHTISELCSQPNISIEDCEQKISELQTKLNSQENRYVQQLDELEKKLVASCGLDPDELETYIECKNGVSSDIGISFAHLTRLKNKLLLCSAEFKEKAGKTIECLNKLLPEDRDILVHVDFADEDKDLAKKIHELLHSHSIHATHSILDGLNNVQHYEFRTIMSCKWIIVLYQKSDNFATVKARLQQFKKYRRRDNGIRILMCSSQVTYSKISTWIDDKGDLIDPDNCHLDIIDILTRNKNN
jgi:flagellin-specific chaperone FliS